MSKVNQKASVAVAKKVYVPGVKEEARRTLVTCLLWEDQAYENGVKIADRMREYVKQLSEQDCRDLLKEAKIDNKLRHAPLFWAVQMAKEGKLKADDVAMICDRVDTMADLLAIYFDENPLTDSEKSKCYDNGKRVHRDNKAVPKCIVKGLQKLTSKKLLIDVKEIKKPDTDAQLVAENIAKQLEERVSFRRAMKSCMGRAMKGGVLGIKTSVSGRLGGADMARTESYSEGTIPLQTLRANIDYGFAEADTTYGKVGVKTWIYHGEVLPAKKEKEGARK